MSSIQLNAALQKTISSMLNQFSLVQWSVIKQNYFDQSESSAVFDRNLLKVDFLDVLCKIHLCCWTLISRALKCVKGLEWVACDCVFFCLLNNSRWRVSSVCIVALFLWHFSQLDTVNVSGDVLEVFKLTGNRHDVCKKLQHEPRLEVTR